MKALLSTSALSAGVLSLSAVALLLGTAGAAGAPDEAAFMQRFVGTWSGGGTVRRTADGSPWTVTCQIVGMRLGSGIRLSGTCRGALIAARQIAAEVAFDERSGRYLGVYTGARVGPARLSGRRHGDTLALTILWPKPVNGNTTAAMTIRNAGNRTLTLTITGRAGPSGPLLTTTDVALRS